MPDQTVTCPKCGHKIEITEAFTHELEAKLQSQHQAELKKREEEFQKEKTKLVDTAKSQELELLKRQRQLEEKEQKYKLETERALAEREKSLNEEHQKSLSALKKEQQEQLRIETEKIKEQARQQAKSSLDVEMKDLKTQLEEKAKQLGEAQNKELELRKRQRELEERERSLKLEVQRTLDDERKRIWEQAAKSASEEQHLKMAEKDKQLSDMHKQVEEMKRKIEQSSQQAQGEVQELELEHILQNAFRFDAIDPVAKGVRGADVLQEVRDEKGASCGSIIWESKRTKAWSDGWIQKLKDDQRVEKAEIAVIVTTALPKDVEHIGIVQGVWVTDFPSAIGLATALRVGLIQVAYTKNSLAGKNDKMELMYSYLSGPEFRQRVEAVIESFTAMQKDLDAERRSMEKQWAKRETQIRRVIQNTAGMYGELQGIIGSALPEITSLELPEDTLPE